MPARKKQDKESEKVESIPPSEEDELEEEFDD